MQAENWAAEATLVNLSPPHPRPAAPATRPAPSCPCPSGQPSPRVPPEDGFPPWELGLYQPFEVILASLGNGLQLLRVTSV